MTTNETRPAAPANAPDAPPSTAQQTRQDESSVGARDPVAESTPGDASSDASVSPATRGSSKMIADTLLAPAIWAWMDSCLTMKSRKVTAS